MLAAETELNPNPVLVFSREGELLCWNEPARALTLALGFDHPRALLPERTVSVVRHCLQSGQAATPFETVVRGRTLVWSFLPVAAQQTVRCHLADVTEQRLWEDQFRHAQKLESVGRLASGLAHDFSNLLTVIQGHTSLLRASAGLTPEMETSLQAIARAAERGTKLTHQLLLFSRKTALQPRRFNLNHLLTDLSLMLQRTLGEDIEFQFHYDPALPDLEADPRLIEQVIITLAVNARDAMAKGGTLLIRTARVTIDEAYRRHQPEARPGHFVCLTMTDTGCGMDPVTLSRLFEPFFTTKEFGQGAGLGLATVYGIVRQHQGWIDVRSQLGQGTSFYIYLPPADPLAPSPAAPAPALQAVPSGETILVVEDEPPVRWTVRNILERAGYKVLEAGSGVEALAVWHQHHAEIHLLVTDMVLPAGLSGQELADTFRHQKPSLKVLYTSGYSLETAGQGLNAVPGVTFLQKPFEATALAAAVRKCLDGCPSEPQP